MGHHRGPQDDVVQQLNVDQAVDVDEQVFHIRTRKHVAYDDVRCVLELFSHTLLIDDEARAGAALAFGHTTCPRT